MSKGALDLAAASIRELSPYQPGKPISELEREYGVSNIIKLASNENPLGPPPAAIEAIQKCMPDLALYPDGNAFELKEVLARRHGVDAACITLGNGSNDILVLMAEAFLTPEHEAVYSQYAFAAWPIAVQCTGARPCVAPALAADDEAAPLGHDLGAMRERVSSRCRLVYIANPNNPTGSWLPADELRSFLADLPDDVITIIDEAYWDYVEEQDYPDTSKWLAEFSNLVVTRTFSKAFGLAGLRVGYSISSPEIADVLNRVRQPFNTSIVAQEAALAALADNEHLTKSVELNRSGMNMLCDALSEMGLTCIPSVCNFVLVDMGRPAGETFEALLRAGIIVRPVANYGLPDHLRITIGLAIENERLIQAMRGIVARQQSV